MRSTWNGTREHYDVLLKAQRDKRDPHAAVADNFGVTRADAKDANFRFLYSAPPKSMRP